MRGIVQAQELEADANQLGHWPRYCDKDPMNYLER